MKALIVEYHSKIYISMMGVKPNRAVEIFIKVKSFQIKTRGTKGMSCLKSLMKLENPKTKFKSMEYCLQ